MSVLVRLAYFSAKGRDTNNREQEVLTGMEKWLTDRGITLHPCSAYAELGEEDGSYNFSNDNSFRYLNIRLPEDVAMMFKLTWGAGVV